MSLKKPPTLPAGVRDFGPSTMLKRQYLIDVLEHSFKKYGFLPMQTPAIEQLTTLTDKYGQEGEQLLFKILNSGDFLAKTTVADYTAGASTLLPKIAKKGLRYDLTIPLARYIATHRHTLTFPFKRFQIQPVWRADRPQKGRYREFYQCDVDVVGTTSLLCEAEMLVMIHEILNDLGIKNFSIQLNHRLIFKALAMHLESPDKEQILCRTLDKLDKIGVDKVLAMLHQQGLSLQVLKKLHWIFELEGNTQACMESLYIHLGKQPAGKQALKELNQLLGYLKHFSLPKNTICITPTLARGLDYYTGAIFEVKIKNTTMGSIAGGGRYDDLTGIFGLPDTPGVGFSFGLERLYEILEAQNLFPKRMLINTNVLLVPLTPQAESIAIQHLVSLRKWDILAEIHTTYDRLKKILAYADKKNIEWVIIIGEEEIKKGLFSLRHMPTKEQKSYTLREIMIKIIEKVRDDMRQVSSQ